MITPTGNFKFYVETKPVDFRKGMDGLAAIVLNEFDLDPFSGAIFIFRSKRADRLKLIVWDGTGLIMTYSRTRSAGLNPVSHASVITRFTHDGAASLNAYRSASGVAVVKQHGR